MILPVSSEITLALAIISALLLGGWASTLKLAGSKWRFELFYFDWAFGVLVAALAGAFTLGSMGDELSFLDNLMVSGKRQMAWALAAGGVFNLANILMVAAISMAGMAVAIPMTMSLAVIAAAVISFFSKGQSPNPAFLFGGAGVVLVSIIFAAMANARRPVTEEAQAGGVRPNRAARPASATKSTVVSLIAGVLMAGVQPLVTLSRAEGSEIGLGPYAIAVMIAVGVFLTTFVYNIYFINLPIHGDAIDFGAYLKGSFGAHVLGVLGGMLWCGGLLAGLAVTAATGAARLQPLMASALSNAAPVVAILFGLLIWRELRSKASALMSLLCLVAYTAGVVLIGLARS